MMMGSNSIRNSESIVQDVLDDLGLEYVETNSDFIISCPHHEENVPSYHIDKISGVNHCFSCHEKGTFMSFIMTLTGETYTDVMLYLSKFSKNLFGNDTGETSLHILKDKLNEVIELANSLRAEVLKIKE
jgi:DNA primase